MLHLWEIPTPLLPLVLTHSQYKRKCSAWNNVHHKLDKQHFSVGPQHWFGLNMCITPSFLFQFMTNNKNKTNNFLVSDTRPVIQIWELSDTNIDLIWHYCESYWLLLLILHCWIVEKAWLNNITVTEDISQYQKVEKNNQPMQN